MQNETVRHNKLSLMLNKDVVVYLNNGIRLVGLLSDFDNSVLVLNESQVVIMSNVGTFMLKDDDPASKTKKRTSA